MSKEVNKNTKSDTLPLKSLHSLTVDTNYRLHANVNI